MASAGAPLAPTTTTTAPASARVMRPRRRGARIGATARSAAHDPYAVVRLGPRPITARDGTAKLPRPAPTELADGLARSRYQAAVPEFAPGPLLSTRFRPDTRLDRGGHYVGSHGGSDGRRRRRGRAGALRRAGRSPGGRPGGALERAAQAGGRPGGALERAAQAGGGPAAVQGRVAGCAGA